MSILNVEHLTHGFGDRAIFQDVSFRLLKGEHIGLVGANGEGKSTFFNIVTDKLMPDEDKSILIFLKITLQPGNVLFVQIVGGLVKKKDVRFLKKKLGKKNLGTLTTA